MFLYDFATKTAQKPDTVATYIRRNEKIFKNHVERKEKQLWLDEKAVKILLKKYPEVQRKKYPWKNDTEFQEAMLSAIKGLWDNFLQSSFFIASSYSFSTILEFLFDDKFDTGYLSASLNWLKFNVYISQFINF